MKTVTVCKTQLFRENRLHRLGTNSQESMNTESRHRYGLVISPRRDIEVFSNFGMPPRVF